MSDYTPGTQMVEDRYWLATVDEEGIRLRAGEGKARADFRAWLAAHDAALIEGLADELRHKGIWAPDDGYMDTYEPSHVEWLREKARERREEQP